MFKQDISFETWGGESGKYRLIDADGNIIDKTPEDTCKRVSRALADIEPKDNDFWFEKFYSVLGTKFAGGGRIMANAGSKNYKKDASLINCVVSRQIPDSMVGIMDVAKEAAIILKCGAGLGYDFSTLRPYGAHVFGAGAGTSGPISFMKIFDAICSTILSGGNRRGAQLACLDIQHPDIEKFISCKRQDGMLRSFNLSCLITDRFIDAVKNNKLWDLWFWQKDNKVCCTNIKVINKNDIPFNYPDYEYFSFAKDHNEVVWGNCTEQDIFIKKIYKTIQAKDLFDLIMESTYSFSEPGMLMIDLINRENNLWFVETIRSPNACGEQPLEPLNNCLLGSILLHSYVKDAFEENCSFDWTSFKNDIKIFNRFLDNVVEISNLPLKELSDNLFNKRRHGLGLTGLGSALNMLRMNYGSKESLDFSESIIKIMAQESLLYSIQVAKEKGCAPFIQTSGNRSLFLQSDYMKRLIDSFDDKQKIIDDIMAYGVRWSHATSIAPTGTLSLSWGNNCSSGIEPVISNSNLRNFRVKNKKTKVQKEVSDLSYFEWKNKFNDKELPYWWSTIKNLSVDDHLNMMSVLQKWCDSSISKTINVSQDCSFDDFKNIYSKAWNMGIKGITTFRFNPEIFSGVLVDQSDLEKTNYTFITEDGTEITLKGNEQVEYDGEIHNVVNLFDALKEGVYGNM